jgi:hypothetical protein
MISLRLKLTDLFLAIPASQQEQRARKQASFDATEEEAADQKVLAGFALGHGCDTDAPNSHDGVEIDRRAHLGKNQVRGDFEQGVANEEDTDDQTVV